MILKTHKHTGLVMILVVNGYPFHVRFLWWVLVTSPTRDWFLGLRETHQVSLYTLVSGYKDTRLHSKSTTDTFKRIIRSVLNTTMKENIKQV